MGRLWSDEDIEWFIQNYPIKGKMFCADHLDRTPATIARQAHLLRLRIDTTSQFFKDFQKKATLTRIGSKRSEATKAKMSKTRTGMIYQKCHKGKFRKQQSTQTT